MNKSASRVACLLLSAMTAFSLVSCKDEASYDSENRPLVMATEALDGNFNPFFATSATDSSMASLTQLGMFTTDEKGNIVCGEDEPTVALDYETIEEKTGDTIDYTTYKILIKNGIQFSDGEPLTIKDVLFNLYVYLDPAYMGSATMYSTDIVGLMNYRAQDYVEDSDYTESDLNQQFSDAAALRKANMLDYLENEDNYRDGLTADETKQIEDDIALTKKLFREEVTTDWTSAAGSQESFKDEYAFTEDWEIYYFNEGLVYTIYQQGKPLRDSNKKYITNLTPTGIMLDDGTEYINDNPSPYAEEIAAVKADQTKLNEYLATGASQEDAEAFVIRDFAIQTVYDANTVDVNLPNVLQYWATGTNVENHFEADAKTAYYEEKKSENEGKLLIDHIEGISASEVTEFKGKKLDETHSMLTIKINGVDPKAIYNFSFAVAPLHYYSGTHKGVNYITAANNKDNFGVAFGDNSFFENILQADEKNKKPVGAGSYQVCNRDGDTGEDVEGNEFYENNWVYFARNEHFKTVGDGIDNAKIKYLRYKVVNSDKLIDALISKDIDVGEPNAKPENIAKIDKAGHLSQKTVDVNGYGYVGINPKFVPDIEVRQAIMKTLNPNYCITSYYTTEYASVIYRSMSTQSWIWRTQKLPTTRVESLKYETDKDEILALVRQAGWVPGSDGKLQKDGKKLTLVFTIAGATTDHPAYTMFSKAADVLNSYGFDIKVQTDISALKKLATGQLAVWAAAWSSTVDPDMYQVYHKDSKATSINNWGYSTIYGADPDGQFTDERNTIDELSEVIVQARETNDQAKRSELYVKALNYVAELAVELPTYQRKDCVAYNKELINPSTLNQNPTAFAGVIDKIWEVDYN